MKFACIVVVLLAMAAGTPVAARRAGSGAVLAATGSSTPLPTALGGHTTVGATAEVKAAMRYVVRVINGERRQCTKGSSFGAGVAEVARELGLAPPPEDVQRPRVSPAPQLAPPRLLSASRAIASGVQLRLELDFGGGGRAAAVVSRGSSETSQASPASGEGDGSDADLERFTLVSLHPEPCKLRGIAADAANSSSSSSSTTTLLAAASWATAAAGSGEHRFSGASAARLAAAAGASVRARSPVEADAAQPPPYSSTRFAEVREEALPDSWDMRTAWPACASLLQPAEQGDCGAGYAFATASVFSDRLCVASKGKLALAVSTQSLISCTYATGCDGGWPATVWKRVESEGVVPAFCMPYAGADNSTGATCGASGLGRGSCAGEKALVLRSEQGSTRSYLFYTPADAAAEEMAANVRRMKQEIMTHGSAVAVVEVHDDFLTYKGGVYSVQARSATPGQQAVKLLGWGYDQHAGQAYWTAQNSWGADWGEAGFFRIRSGVNEAGLEAYGLAVTTPLLPDAASLHGDCQHGGIARADGSCTCSAGWAGDKCDVCPLQCENGGRIVSGSCACACTAPFFGERCQSALFVSPTLACANAPVYFHTVLPGVQLRAGDSVVLHSSVDGPLYGPPPARWHKAADKPLCAASGLLAADSPCASGPYRTLWSFPRAGKYRLSFVRYLGRNEFGHSQGYATHYGQQSSGVVTVVNCDDATAGELRLPASLAEAGQDDVAVVVKLAQPAEQVDAALLRQLAVALQPHLHVLPTDMAVSGASDNSSCLLRFSLPLASAVQLRALLDVGDERLSTGVTAQLDVNFPVRIIAQQAASGSASAGDGAASSVDSSAAAAVKLPLLSLALPLLAAFMMMVMVMP